MPYRSRHLPVAFRVTARTNVGLCRDHNEDAFSIAAPGFKTTYGPPSSRASLTAFAVACGVFDGCGRSEAGEVGSQMVASFVDEALQPPWPSSCEDLGGRLVLALQAAARRLFMHSAADPRSARLVTTATLVAAVDNHLQLAHIGDARAYLFRGGELTQVSSDHTLINLLLQQG